MSGHSKWSSIKHKKAAKDAKRGRAYTRLIKEITVAARFGGGDPDANPRLRTAISAAQSENMPKDNITRAIKKGIGEIEGATYEEFTYEGYGPGGTAVLLEVVTDNKNRTVAEVRHAFSKNNGTLGESGCVAWMFEKRGMLVFPKDQIDEDALMEAALEAGAEDIEDADDVWEVYTTPNDFVTVREALESKNITPSFAENTMIPQTTIKLEGKVAGQMMKLMDAIEDLDDVQNSYSNFDIDAEELESLAS